MSIHPRTVPTRTLSLAAVVSLAGLLAACGSAEVELVPTVDAAVSTEVEPEPEPEPEPVVEETETADEASDDASEAAATEAPVAEAPATTSSSSSSSSTTTSTSTGASHPEPDLVVGEDGCVTDRSIGLVIACHDDAAGPDEVG